MNTNFIKKLIRELFVENSTLQGYVAHSPIGATTVILAKEVDPEAALIFGGAFIVYEIMHEWRLKDRSWNDLAGFMVGIVIAGFIYRVI